MMDITQLLGIVSILANAVSYLKAKKSKRMVLFYVEIRKKAGLKGKYPISPTPCHLGTSAPFTPLSTSALIPAISMDHPK